MVIKLIKNMAYRAFSDRCDLGVIMSLSRFTNLAYTKLAVNEKNNVCSENALY